MKTLEATKRFLAGEPLMVAEFRMAVVDVINFRDKKTGAARSADVIKTTVETATRSITFTEFVRDEKFVADKFVPSFQKGDKVVIQLESLQESRGIMTGGGILHRLEP